ncbi:hypothetical protein Pmani_030168 [Petrolisthes manimaculis]|uniref:Uncharacterized protein n=1 Tax=Petrolisthes manimaculis TaxID=1843537 RepID=A0AAE1TTW6_9EUCA|nr:hypothetical protein Pmani_030168 [Petrolisthes manimaculis]
MDIDEENWLNKLEEKTLILRENDATFPAFPDSMYRWQCDVTIGVGSDWLAKCRPIVDHCYSEDATANNNKQQQEEDFEISPTAATPL